MNEDLLVLVNDHLKSKNLVNRIWGVRKKQGQVECRICPEDKEIFWLSLFQNCIEVEKFINNYMNLGGEIE
jgi:hypothetical protein